VFLPRLGQEALLTVSVQSKANETIAQTQRAKWAPPLRGGTPSCKLLLWRCLVSVVVSFPIVDLIVPRHRL